MGIIYYIACKRCKTYRNLDKLIYLMNSDHITTRSAAVDFSKVVETNSFRAGLLISFMSLHFMHEICMYSDMYEGVPIEYEEEKYNFWRQE